MSETTPLERAIAALRAGRPVRLGGLDLLALETSTASILALLDADRGAQLLISGARGAALGLGNQLEAASDDAPVLIARPHWLDVGAAMELADPSHDGDRGPIGPLEALQPPGQAGAALRLARLSGLLPALWLLPAGNDVAARLEVADLDMSPTATIVSRARLPLDDMPCSQMVSFRDPASGEDHVALVVGAFAGKPPLVRLHSECLTGDVFGSLKCDCGPQLKEALRTLGAEGGGVLLYLRQEGRGIGLANKLRAYALQDRGLDTVDANRRLGFADDSRDYGMAAAMLRALHIDEVRLLTNNPNKVAGLESAGIRVVERVAHHMPVNPHNADYVATKRARSGHLA